MLEDHDLTTKTLVDSVQSRDTRMFHEAVAELHYADLADIFENLAVDERQFFTETIQVERFAEIIPNLPDSLVEEAIDRFDIDAQRELLDQITDDDLVDVLQDVSDLKREKLLSLVEPDEAETTRSLLKYGEDTAGGRMTTHPGTVTSDMSVKQALDYIQKDHGEAESLARIYVVDQKDRLQGRVRFRDLAFNTWDTPITDICRDCEHTLLASADQEEASLMFSKYDLMILPVVDEQHRLLGVITHDDAMEILEEESTEDIEKMAGMAGEQSQVSYLNTTISTHFKRRFPWLLGLAFLAIASGIVMIQYESVLTELYILSLFLPMVVAAGGNTGGQASTMVIRAMALGELGANTFWRVAWKELKLGLLLGSLLGLCIAVASVFVVPVFGSLLPETISLPKFGLSIAIALATQITTSTLVGSLLPIGARAANIDPAIVAAPAITTIVDVSGMVIYFTVASLILGV